MIDIVAGLLAMVILGSLVTLLVISAKKAKKSAEGVISKANRLAADMDIVESDLAEIRQQIKELSNTLYEIEADITDTEEVK